MQKGGSLLLDLLYPPQCLGCNLWYRFGSSSVWCERCECKRLSAPSNRRRLIECVHVFAAHAYECDEVARVVQGLKYERIAAAADLCALWLEPLYRSLPSAGQISVLIPVPLHERRRRERGFNQAELISRALGSLVKIDTDTTLLERVRYTTPQALATEEVRQQQLDRAFSATRLCSSDTHYIIIDDVVTTGSTFGECIRALRAAGAVHISALAVAST